MKFKKGDRVTHFSGNESMNAVFHHYCISMTGPRRVIVEYTEERRKGRKGCWLEDHCVLLFDDLVKGSEETSSNPGKDDQLKRKNTLMSHFMDNAVMASIGPRRGTKVAGTRPTHIIMDDMQSEIKPHQEIKMKDTITEIYVDGVLTDTLIGEINVDNMSSSEMLHAIGNVNAAIEKLNKHELSSKFVEQEARRLHKFIKSVYKLLDNKFADKGE